MAGDYIPTVGGLSLGTNTNTTSAIWSYGVPGASEERQEHMGQERGLYRVITVDPEKGTVEIDELVVANDEVGAKLKVLRDIAGDLDDFDIIVVRLGNVKPKRRPQEVKIVDK